MGVLCRTKEEIERIASRLPCVPTDNFDAMMALGFERLYPQTASGYVSHLWARSVELRSIAGARKLVVQRAFLNGRARR